MSINELPMSWQREVKDLRKENARLRMRCRETGFELDEARAELAALKASK